VYVYIPLETLELNYLRCNCASGMHEKREREREREREKERERERAWKTKLNELYFSVGEEAARRRDNR